MEAEDDFTPMLKCVVPPRKMSLFRFHITIAHAVTTATRNTTQIEKEDHHIIREPIM